jgi:NadR type nicotinamide-nucleotide adenylyltransferase
MPKAIVLMTALVPTLGHKYLIDFATRLAEEVHVIVGTMNREPIDGYKRRYALSKTYESNPFVTVHHLHRDVPQEPNEHPDFWNVWRDIVCEFVDVQPDDYFVASELYGIDMANVLGCKFMPCNRYRETVPIKGTTVRQNLLDNFHHILPEFQQFLVRSVTIFGAESCGKTTMTRALADTFDGWFIPEWAREYLETVGPEITAEKMRSIVEGQTALQATARVDLKNKPLIFQDTDLLSTLGYYRLWGGGSADDLACVTALAVAFQSHLYVVMNDQIPFEPDQLRYGGDKRESKMDFWIDLLKEFHCPYIVVPYGTHEEHLAWLTSQLMNWHDEQFEALIDYRR